MASPISKHPRKGRRDIISGLPDEILFHILSSMPTKNAVQTSSLSKRWSHLWTSVPAIDINDHNPLLRYWQKRNFMLLVDRVLHFNDVSHLRKLCLTCNASYDQSRVIKWIKSVTIRNMEELDLSFGDKHSYDCDMCSIKDCDILGEEGGINFPLGNFTNKKLEILKLTDKGNNIILKAPTSIYLPNLRILHLHLLRFPKDDSLQNLLNGSPNLEELDIELLGSEETMHLIRSSSLKSLRVRTHCYMDATEQLRIVVDAQNIEKLDIMDDVKVLYDLKSLPSLVKVNLDHCKTCSKFIDVEGNSRLNELLSMLSNTKYLFLSREIMKCLEYSILDNLPVFYNLHHLELKTIDYSWLVLPCLLERSPNLRTLVLYKEQSREWHLQFQTRECLMLNLEEIKFSGFKGSDDEMEMVKYFLTISKVLKKFSIKCYYSSSKKQSEIVKKLLMFPRGSTECQIIFN